MFTSLTRDSAAKDEDGQPVVVNTDLIAAITIMRTTRGHPHYKGDLDPENLPHTYTWIAFTHSYGITVKESPEEIVERIERRREQDARIARPHDER